MNKPLPPTYVNERARVEEHQRFMAEARLAHGTRFICPDCYLLPSRCIHRNPYRT